METSNEQYRHVSGRDSLGLLQNILNLWEHSPEALGPGAPKIANEYVKAVANIFASNSMVFNETIDELAELRKWKIDMEYALHDLSSLAQTLYSCKKNIAARVDAIESWLCFRNLTREELAAHLGMLLGTEYGEKLANKVNSAMLFVPDVHKEE